MDDEADGTAGAGEGASCIAVSVSPPGVEACAEFDGWTFFFFSFLLFFGVGSAFTSGAGADAGEASFNH